MANSPQPPPPPFATTSIPGLVSTAEQSFSGLKIFTNGLKTNNVIESTSGGFKFPNATTQVSACTGTVNTQVPATGNGSPGNPICVREASTTQNGVVSISVQGFSGKKSFSDQISIGGTASDDTLSLQKGDAANNVGLRINNVSGAAKGYFGVIGTSGQYISSSAEGDVFVIGRQQILFASGIGTYEGMRLTINNNLLIGTTADDGHRLKVGGNAAVSGTLNASGGVKSKGETTSRWRGVSYGAPATSEDGDLYFDSSDNKVYIRANSNWVALN